jgi:hypothetical protein
VLDIAVAASTDRHALLRNDIASGRNWLVVKLIGAAGELGHGTNRDAVGARVIIRANGLQQLREVIWEMVMLTEHTAPALWAGPGSTGG